jgi:hypothetical protein
MKFETIDQGFLFQGQPGTSAAVAAGSRCVRTNSGDLLCTFMVQSALSVNDLKIMLARSRDGVTWQEPHVLWPKLAARQSMFGSLSRSPVGELFIYGFLIPIDNPGESFWSDAAQGLKQNSLFWAKSVDEGQTWTAPALIPMPYSGSAEAPGPMCVARDGVWLCCYAPYNSFDPKLKVERDRIVVLRSENQGKTWSAQPMIRFPDPASGGAEAWVIELADGRLLGTCWNVGSGGFEYSNPYALSLDAGRTWLPARSTGILGQSTALLALSDGRALMAYNQRKHGEVGVWVAVARPTPDDFGLETNEILWRAATATQKGTSGNLEAWADFAFGEPCLTLLDNGELLLTLWCIQPDGSGIRFLKFRMKD